MTLHISSAFNEDLIHINGKIVEMGGLCEQVITNSNLSIKDNNVQMAENAILLDEKIDLLETEINESVIKAIALRQPVADDLRVLFSAIKISGAFERVGDLCKNIAKRSQLLTEEHHTDIRNQIFKFHTTHIGEMTHFAITGENLVAVRPKVNLPV